MIRKGPFSTYVSGVIKLTMPQLGQIFHSNQDFLTKLTKIRLDPHIFLLPIVLIELLRTDQQDLHQQ